jgi:hypothetical protein
MWPHRADRFHRRREPRNRITVRPVSSDVRIAELHDQKRGPHAEIIADTQ